MFSKNPIIAVVAVLVIVGCLGRFYVQIKKEPKVNVEPFAALGEFVGEETSKLLPARSSVVVLFVDTAKYKIPTLDTMLATFQKTVKQKGNISIAGVEKFRLPFPTFLAMSSGSLVLPTAEFHPSQFETVLKNHSGADAIVSFVGFPSTLSGTSPELQQKHPKIIVVSERNPQLTSFLQSRVFDLAIVPRSSEAGPQNPVERQKNNRPYEVLTLDK